MMKLLGMAHRGIRAMQSGCARPWFYGIFPFFQFRDIVYIGPQSWHV